MSILTATVREWDLGGLVKQNISKLQAVATYVHGLSGQQLFKTKAYLSNQICCHSAGSSRVIQLWEGNTMEGSFQ